MDQRRPWLVLLLPLCWCYDSKVPIAKVVGRGPDVTPICTNDALNVLKVLCKISTEGRGGEKCVLYKEGSDLMNGCDPRFTLITENQTVFLHLADLRPADSGNYSCQCSRPEGTYVLDLNITVEDPSEEEPSSSSPGSTVGTVFGVIAALSIVPGVVLVRILREKHCSNGDDTRSEASECATSHRWDRDEPDDNNYKNLEHSASDFYQNISTMYYDDDAKSHLAGDNIATAYFEEESDVENDRDDDIYENV